MNKYNVCYDILNGDQTVTVIVEADDENGACSKGTIAMFNDNFDINQIELLSVELIKEEPVPSGHEYTISYDTPFSPDSGTKMNCRDMIFAVNIGEALYSYLLEHDTDGIEIIGIKKICQS